MNNDAPLVSVCIPAYNHEQYIRQTIESIILQTYRNIELLIIDDGSTDGTLQQIFSLKEKCENRFVRVVMLTQKNSGTCRTMNRLIELARGDFIYFIASDDVAKSHALAVEVKFLTSHPEYVLVVGDNELIDTSSERTGWDAHQNNVPLTVAKYHTFGAFLQSLYPDIDFHSESFGAYENFVTRNYVPNGYLITAKALRQTGGYKPEAPLEDWYMMLQLSKIGKMKYLDDVLFSYRWHQNNTVKKKAYMWQITLQTKRYEKEVVSRPGFEHWQEIFSRFYPSIRYKFRLGKFLAYYKLVDIDCRTNILDICGRKFVIKRKSLA